jgi:hypothetical protein
MCLLVVAFSLVIWILKGRRIIFKYVDFYQSRYSSCITVLWYYFTSMSTEHSFSAEEARHRTGSQICWPNRKSFAVLNWMQYTSRPFVKIVLHIILSFRPFRIIEWSFSKDYFGFDAVGCGKVYKLWITSKMSLSCLSFLALTSVFSAIPCPPTQSIIPSGRKGKRHFHM